MRGRYYAPHAYYYELVETSKRLLLGSFYVLSQIATGEWRSLGPDPGHPGEQKPRLDFPSVAPAIFINMIIALSLDYTLFVLTTYADERRGGSVEPRLSFDAVPPPEHAAARAVHPQRSVAPRSAP